MFSKLLVILCVFLIYFINVDISKKPFSADGGHLLCINENTKYFSFGNNEQLVDLLWIRFLQEVDAYNEYKIAEAHLCPDATSSWHFQILNVAIDLDPKFYEMAITGPLAVSVTISDAKGASILFDKVVKNFPNKWKVLYQAGYQAIFEEKDFKKAADLLTRAGQNGAPNWVLSLAGGLYNEVGMKTLAESIYQYLVDKFPEDQVTRNLKQKLDNKVKNFYEKK